MQITGNIRQRMRRREPLLERYPYKGQKYLVFSTDPSSNQSQIIFLVPFDLKQSFSIYFWKAETTIYLDMKMLSKQKGVKWKLLK